MSNDPTAADRRYWSKVTALGCIACHINKDFDTPAEIHHIKEYGYHDHRKVLPLCPPHHRPTAEVKGVPSRHRQPKEFRKQFGSDQELLEQVQQLIGGKP